MAQRRMFSLRIVDSTKFLKMPLTSRCLYYDLGMRADDDGIVEAFRVMRTVGATEDDLKILIAKDFVKVLNDDLVTHIVDWTEHNTIRADRKVDSIYKELLLQILPLRQSADKCQPSDNQVATKCPHRLGKVSIDKESVCMPTLAELNAYCAEIGKKMNTQRFVDFYESKGWHVGNSPMKDWRACVRNWEDKRDINNQKRKGEIIDYDKDFK